MARLLTKADLFGHVLYNYFHKDGTPYAIVRDDGNRDFPEDPAVYFKPKIFVTESRGMKYVRGLILDVGCGAGRHALYFQKRGLKVVAIDTDRYCVKIAKERGVKIVIKEDIFRPNRIRRHKFDTVWFAGNNLGIAGTIKRLPRLFRILDSLTSPEALVLATGIEFERTNNPVHKAYHRRQKGKGLYPGQMKLRIEYKNLKSKWIPWLHVSSKTLQNSLRRSQWYVEKFLRSKDGCYLAVIRKKKEKR